INNVVRGSFLSASLGYYLGSRFVGNGYMVEALTLVKQHAFRRLGLHRIEANIQPDNIRSLNLVKRCGFVREGISPAYLFINGAWRDHERWAAVDDRDTLSRTDTWR
ncbi:MAG: GNAT family N-acetyltransferase, partial [Gammaproteobacteria bacterium]|nr:GNAT family N-acetyltransferase [Gammaproteobacteria bacterium]